MEVTSKTEGASIMTSIYADKVLVNRNIHTGSGRYATSLAILGERIALLGLLLFHFNIFLWGFRLTSFSLG
jgi:hypothetical protein